MYFVLDKIVFMRQQAPEVFLSAAAWIHAKVGADSRETPSTTRAPACALFRPRKSQKQQACRRNLRRQCEVWLFRSEGHQNSRGLRMHRSGWLLLYLISNE